MSQIQNNPIIDLPSLYKYGMVLANGNVGTSLNISSGECRDSNNIIDIEIGGEDLEGDAISAPLILDMTVNGVNGLDVGAIEANTMYAIYMIADSRYYKPTGCIATIGTNDVPSIPSGYDSYRLIGYWATNGSSVFYAGYYSGISNDLNFRYDGFVPVLTGGTSIINAVVSVATVAPYQNNVLVELYSNYTGAAATTSILNLFNGNNSGAPNVVYTTQVAGVPLGNTTSLMTGFLSTPGTPYIVYRVTAGDSVNLAILGFEASV